MSTDYEPGTIAMIRDNSTDDRSEWRAVKDEKGWIGTDPSMGWVADCDVTEVRPLVVLDPSALVDCAEDARLIPQWMRVVASVDVHDLPRTRLVQAIADQFEAQTRPPRIPEPGLWAVVKARLNSRRNSTVWTAIHVENGWWRVDDGGEFVWSELIDPVLIREGIES